MSSPQGYPQGEALYVVLIRDRHLNPQLRVFRDRACAEIAAVEEATELDCARLEEVTETPGESVLAWWGREAEGDEVLLIAAQVER